MIRIYVFFSCVILVHADQTACKVRLSKGTNSADLVCYFSEDIKQLQKDFGVYHFNGKGKKEAVVDCLWHSDGLKCITKKKNYQIDTAVTDRVTVKIHNVTGDVHVGGKYTCQTSGMKREEAGFCELSTGETSCEIHARGSTSESALTCYFPEDVGISKKDFSVYHFDLKGRPKAVVDCRWMSDNLRCSVMPGYHYDNAVTSSATVIIPKMSQHSSGLYGCHITGTQLEEINLCEHSFTEKTACQIISNEELQLTCSFNEDISHSKKNFFVIYFNESGIPATVVDCRWHMGDLNCTTLPGYQAATTVSDQFSVVLPKLSESKTGSYQCHVSGAHGSHATLCGLPLNGCETEASCSPICLEVTLPIVGILGLTVLSLSLLVFRQGLSIIARHYLSIKNNEDTAEHDPAADTGGEKNMESGLTMDPETSPEVSEQSDNHSARRQRSTQVKID